MPLVDGRGYRHQFDSGDAYLLQMRDDRRVRQRANRAALGFRHFRVQLGERADCYLVDQPAGPEDRLLPRHRVWRGDGDRLRHQRSRIATPSARFDQSGIVYVRPVDLERIRVHQKLVGIEKATALRIVFAVGAKTVAHSGPQVRHG